tara:strand:+ start:29143 stop:30321 length:1179 start_codon:yes stop_codon:yes gene_type:complete
MEKNNFLWPLINDNITSDDKHKLVEFILTPGVRFTQHKNVRMFENKWSEWLGSKHTTFVNSGASANWIMASALKDKVGTGEIILSPFGWVSDIVPFLELGFTPVFVDVNRETMSIDASEVEKAITKDTKAILAVHILGFNALSEKLLDLCDRNSLMLIEDCCEAHGATYKNKKVGTFGDMSNFSFYFGHHMTTIEGGAISTNSDKIHDTVRMLRSHGMTREASDETKEKYKKDYPHLNPLFTFAVPGYNVRSTELNAVIGLNQLKRLDNNISIRTENLKVWLENLNSKKYQTDFITEGSSNFSLPLVLNKKDNILLDKVKDILNDKLVEYRLGTAGGGNQSRQPYLEKFKEKYREYDMPNLNHIHEYGLYIGNHTEVTKEMILTLCREINDA